MAYFLRVHLFDCCTASVGSEIKNSEIFPDSFDAVWKDRASNAHGGVFIAFKRGLLCTETLELDTCYDIPGQEGRGEILLENSFMR